MTSPKFTWERTKNWFPRMAGVFAELAIGIPGIIIVFANNNPTRWSVAGLTAIFIGISIVYSSYHEETVKRFTSPYLIVQTLLTVALIYLNPTLTFYVIWFYVLTIEAIMGLPRREGLIWLGVYILLTVVLLALLTPLPEALVMIPIFLGGFFFFVTFANMTFEANETRAESQRLLEELQTTHAQLQEYAMNAEDLAVSEERNRLAREMHDTVGHRLTVSAVQLEAAGKLIEKDPPRATQMVETVREQVRGALAELRSSVATLRQPLEADLRLDVSLKRLVANFEQATGISIHLLLSDQIPALSTAHRLALYRTTQESLTNVQRHAQAKQVWLQLARRDDTITLRVSDNGVGYPKDTPETGFGLRGIQERVAQLGGQLRFETRPGGGAQLWLSLPLVLEGTNV